MNEAELEALAREVLTFKQPGKTVIVGVAYIEGATPFAYIDSLSDVAE